MKIDKRKTYYLVVDVETADKVESPLVYDLGYAVCDRKGTIYEKGSFVINNIFYGYNEKMQTAYYAEKLPQYYDGIEKGEWQPTNLSNAREIIKQVIKKYNVKMVLAYNAYFDRNALNNTMAKLTNLKYFFPYGTEFGCIWSMACQVLCCQKSYLKWAIDNGFVSPSGNIKTSAETVYAYLSGQKDFQEQHTGLADVEIETYIFAQCMRQHKKLKKEINRLCWRIPTKRAKELALL